MEEQDKTLYPAVENESGHTYMSMYIPTTVRNTAMCTHTFTPTSMTMRVQMRTTMSIRAMSMKTTPMNTTTIPTVTASTPTHTPPRKLNPL